jgi:hypothetical protein
VTFSSKNSPLHSAPALQSAQPVLESEVAKVIMEEVCSRVWSIDFFRQLEDWGLLKEEDKRFLNGAP